MHILQKVFSVVIEFVIRWTARTVSNTVAAVDFDGWTVWNMDDVASIDLGILLILVINVVIIMRHFYEE